MRYVKASMLTHDASIGRVEPGQTYYVEDDKAERWINAGIAVAGTAPPQPPAPDPTPIPPQPQPEEKDDEDDEDDGEDDEDDEELRAQVQKLSAEGASQRAIGDQLNLSRATVRRLLAA